MHILAVISVILGIIGLYPLIFDSAEVDALEQEIASVRPRVESLSSKNQIISRAYNASRKNQTLKEERENKKENYLVELKMFDYIERGSLSHEICQLKEKYAGIKNHNDQLTRLIDMDKDLQSLQSTEQKLVSVHNKKTSDTEAYANQVFK